MRVGRGVRILVTITPPPVGKVLIESVGVWLNDDKQPHVVSRTGDVGATAALWLTPKVGGIFNLRAEVMSAEGCYAATGLVRTVLVQ